MSTQLTAAEIDQLSKQYLVPVYARRFAVDFVGGQGATLFDSEGKNYIDCCAGIAVNSLGYNHPDLQKAASAALTLPWHFSNIFNNAPSANLAKLLVETSGFADRVHFSLCGASANEGAFKFARKYGRTRHGDHKTEILAFSNAFHGRLFGSLAATPRPHYQDSFKPLMPGVRFANFNDINSVKAQFNSNICAVIVEPIQGEGGVYAADPAFLSELRALCDQHDALLIYDEVQCGVGRTGKLWAWQHSGVAPDILTTAKPLANGLPIGAILVRDKVAEVMSAGDHASTFAGGPFICAIAHSVVEIISSKSFLQSVQDKNAYLIAKLRSANLKAIKEIRGLGLILGLQLESSAVELAQKAFENGLVAVPAGANVLRLVPPLVISEQEMDLAVERLQISFEQLL